LEWGKTLQKSRKKNDLNNGPLLPLFPAISPFSLQMYVVVQAQEGDEAERYGAVTGMKRLEQIRNDRNGSKFGSRTAAIIASSLAAVALVALATMNNNEDAPVAEESTFTGSMQKYNPTTGLLVTKYADPGFYMRVWWGTPVAWDDLKGPWSSAKTLLGESKTQTYITSINFPRASTLTALIGPPVPKPGTSDFQTLVCVWKGRFEVVNGGLYNLTLRSSAAGATLTISGETVIVNNNGDSETATDVKLGGGFHEIQVLWKAPGDDRPNDPAYIGEHTHSSSSRGGGARRAGGSPSCCGHTTDPLLPALSSPAGSSPARAASPELPKRPSCPSHVWTECSPFSAPEIFGSGNMDQGKSSSLETWIQGYLDL
jgi:hypothetical protein